MAVLVVYFSKSNKDSSRSLGFFNRIGKITLDIYLIHWFFLPHLEIPGITNERIIKVQLVLASAIAYVIVRICEVVSCTLRFSGFIAKYALGAKNKKNE